MVNESSTVFDAVFPALSVALTLIRNFPSAEKLTVATCVSPFDVNPLAPGAADVPSSDVTAILTHEASKLCSSTLIVAVLDAL